MAATQPDARGNEDQRSSLHLLQIAYLRKAADTWFCIARRRVQRPEAQRQEVRRMTSVIQRFAASQPWLDSVADAIQPRLQEVLARRPRLRDALDGRWLGAPLHPVLTDVPIGAWTVAVLLDRVEPDRRAGLYPADAALAIGVAAAVPAALTGLSDWGHLRGETRRVGSLHAALNSAGLLLTIASLACRLTGRRASGHAFSLAGYGLASVAAHAGGELSFRMGVRVNRTAWPTGDDEWSDVLDEAELDDTGLKRVEVGEVPVLVARSAEGEIWAIHATCSHLGGPLDEGDRDGDVIRCPWHGSRFDLCTGRVLAAPAVFPQPQYEARVRDGRIELRPAPG
jgi:nitrite reductase/ring-hydroxylating ferredoxin subunit